MWANSTQLILFFNFQLILLKKTSSNLFFFGVALLVSLKPLKSRYLMLKFRYFLQILLILSLSQTISSSLVVDSKSQISVTDYCPKMKFCAEGAHVMCMYYNPVSYTYIHRQAFFQVNGASFYCGHTTKIDVTREKLIATIAFSRQTQLTLSSSNSTFLNKSHDRTFCLSCMNIIYKFLEATLLYLNSPFFHFICCIQRLLGIVGICVQNLDW